MSACCIDTFRLHLSSLALSLSLSLLLSCMKGCSCEKHVSSIPVGQLKRERERSKMQVAADDTCGASLSLSLSRFASLLVCLFLRRITCTHLNASHIDRAGNLCTSKRDLCDCKSITGAEREKTFSSE